MWEKKKNKSKNSTNNILCFDKKENILNSKGYNKNCNRKIVNNNENLIIIHNLIIKIFLLKMDGNLY